MNKINICQKSLQKNTSNLFHELIKISKINDEFLSQVILKSLNGDFFRKYSCAFVLI